MIDEPSAFSFEQPWTLDKVGNFKVELLVLRVCASQTGYTRKISYLQLKMTSSPTLKPVSRIARLKDRGTQSIYHKAWMYMTTRQ